MDLGLTGKRALVTAASRGLGRASAVSLAREGARVAVASRNPAALDEVVAAIDSAGGPAAMAVEMDIGDGDSIDRGVAQVADAFGGLDILVGNTPGPPSGPFLAIDRETWRRAFDTTIHPMADLARAVLPLMQEAGGGRIIFITTVGVKIVQPEMVLSDATRLAITGLAKSLALEFAADDILVNSLCPGPIATDRYHELIAATRDRHGLSEEEAEAVWLDEVPVGRAGRPEDFGDLVAVLASGAASFVTGAAIAVDGGKSRAY
jgi:3-oxoacyl-[acyl-carrier protein] reductase